MQIWHFKKNFQTSFFSFFGHFTSCWTPNYLFSILITVCNSLNSLNKDSLPNSGHFLLKKSSSFLTFWLRKPSKSSVSGRNIYRHSSWVLWRVWLLTKASIFLSKKHCLLPLNWPRKKLPKILAAELRFNSPWTLRDATFIFCCLLFGKNATSYFRRQSTKPLRWIFEIIRIFQKFYNYQLLN